MIILLNYTRKQNLEIGFKYLSTSTKRELFMYHLKKTVVNSSFLRKKLTFSKTLRHPFQRPHQKLCFFHQTNWKLEDRVASKYICNMDTKNPHTSSWKEYPVRKQDISGRYAGSYLFEVFFIWVQHWWSSFLRCIWFLLCYNVCAQHFHCPCVSMCQLPSCNAWLVNG